MDDKMEKWLMAIMVILQKKKNGQENWLSKHTEDKL